MNVTVWPATSIVPVRTPVVVFGATVYWTGPSPCAGAELTVIQLALLAAVHAQLEPVMTVSALVSPFEVTETLNGDTEYVHCASAARASTRQASAISTQ